MRGPAVALAKQRSPNVLCERRTTHIAVSKSAHADVEDELTVTWTQRKGTSIRAISPRGVGCFFGK